MKFELDDGQMAKLTAWKAAQDRIALEQQRPNPSCEFAAMLHKEGEPYYGAIGGSLTYSFTPTSVGEVCKVTHGFTKAVLDLSDYGSW